MEKWNGFWAGLNIRKALSLMFGIAMIIGSLSVIFSALDSTPIDKDMITYGLSGIMTVTTTLVGYYFGYSNGIKTGNNNNDQL